MIKALTKLNRHAVLLTNSDEDEHQRAFIDWKNETAALQVDVLKRQGLEWLHAIPNGGGRGKPFITKRGTRLPPLQAVALKNAGVKSGITDLRLDYVTLDESGRIVCPGLIIEMKVIGQPLSPDQRQYFKFMRKQGFQCELCYSWQKAALVTVQYMKLDKIAPVYVETAQNHVVTVRDPHDLMCLSDKIQ